MTNYVINQIKVKSYFKGSPSKLEVEYINQSNFKFEEGDILTLQLNDFNLFYGHIFTQTYSSNYIQHITAYDQLRYLICRDTISYSFKTATQLANMIFSDFKLKVGYVENTSYVIPYRIEENQTILDIIYSALNLTTEQTGEKFVLYDEFGSLTIKNIKSMFIPILLDFNNSILDYSYTSTIDRDVYNSIKVSIKDRKTKTISQYIVKDPINERKWGTLQLFKRLNNTFTKAQAETAAMAILKQKNRTLKTFRLIDFGHPSVKAGTVLKIKTDDNNFNDMLVKECLHIIKVDEHTMQLSLENI